MNTFHDTTRSRLPGNLLGAEQITPAQRPRQIYRRILVGTDFSDTSKLAIEQGLKLAKQNNAELLIGHCFSVPNCVTFAPPQAYSSWENQCRMEAEKNIGPIIEEARREGLKAHMLILSGNADDAILKVAKRLEVDLIVIGTHGRRTVPRLFLGSIAAGVVLRAQCAVLTVRLPRGKKLARSDKVI